MVAYASIDDLLPLFETPPKDTRRPRLEGLLEVATSELIGECGGRDYFRHPTAGSRTWTIDGEGGDVLHLHEGLIEISLLEISLDGGQSFIELDPAHYQLLGARYLEGELPGDGEPYFHVRLRPPPIGLYGCFPRGQSVIRPTGATGWATAPRVLVEATAERARQLAYADPSYSGSLPGPDEYSEGGQGASDRWPQLLWNWLRNERLRFYACSM